MKFSTLILPLLSTTPALSTPIGWKYRYSVADQSVQLDTLPAHLYDTVHYLTKLPKDELKLIVDKWEVEAEAAITTVGDDVLKLSKLDQEKRKQLGSLTTDFMDEWLSADQGNPLLLELIAEKYEVKYDALTQSSDHQDNAKHSGNGSNPSKTEVQPTRESSETRSGGDFLSTLHGILQDK